MALSAGNVFARMEEWSSLDPAVDAGRRLLGPDGPAAAVPDLAQQARRWLGHPIHPAFAQLSAGLLLSAGVADWLPRTGTAVPALTAAGLVTAVPTAVSGYGDWAAVSRPHARLGVVHAGLNVAALVAFTASLAVRARGKGVKGRGFGALGTGLIGVSAAVGGHLGTAAAAGPSPAGVAASLGVDPADLNDEDLVREIDSLHRTRGDTLRSGSANALATHTERMAALEAEYLRRSPREGGDRMSGESLPGQSPAAASAAPVGDAVDPPAETASDLAVASDLAAATGDAAQGSGGAPADLSQAHAADGSPVAGGPIHESPSDS